MARIPLVNKGGAIVTPNRSDELGVPSSKKLELAGLVTEDYVASNMLKVKEEFVETFANGDSVDISIDDAAGNFAMVSAKQLTFSGTTQDETLTLDSTVEDLWEASNWKFDDSGVYVEQKSGFYDYGKFTYENVTDYTKLRYWTVDTTLNPELFVSWVADVLASDPDTAKQKTLTFASDDPSTKKLRMVSDSFIIANYLNTLKLKFNFSVTNIAPGGTISALKFQIVDAKDYGTVLYESTDLAGSGTVDDELSAAVFNRKIRFAIYLEYVGAAGPASDSLTIDSLMIYDANVPARIIKLYETNTKSFLSPYPTMAIDFSTLPSGDWVLSSINITDGLQTPDGVNVAVSKDAKNWYYYENGEWKVVLSSMEFSTTPVGLAALTMDELDFLMKDNESGKIYFMFKPNEKAYPGSMAVKEVKCTFAEAPTISDVTGVDVTITAKTKVTFTNNSGADIDNAILDVVYL